MDEDVQVTCRCTIWSCLTPTSNANARAFVDARRNIDGDGLAFIRSTFATASPAGGFNHFAATVAGRACALDYKETLLRAHLAMTSAQVAATFTGPWRCAGAFTGAACRCDIDGDFRFFAVEGLIERDFKVIA